MTCLTSGSSIVGQSARRILLSAASTLSLDLLPCDNPVITLNVLSRTNSPLCAADTPYACLMVWHPKLKTIVQELCESRGGRPGLSVLTSLLVSVDVKLY